MEREPTERKILTLPRSFWRGIVAHQEAQRIGSQAEAARQVMLAGLRALGIFKEEEPGSEDDV